MSDLNKDIDRLKELQSTIYEGGDYIYLNKNDKQALGNVLKELETRTVQVSGQVSGQVQELETWKKIAEMLASEYAIHVICRNTAGGMTIGEIEDVLNWARKEVFKNE